MQQQDPQKQQNQNQKPEQQAQQEQDNNPPQVKAQQAQEPQAIKQQPDIMAEDRSKSFGESQQQPGASDKYKENSDIIPKENSFPNYQDDEKPSQQQPETGYKH